MYKKKTQMRYITVIILDCISIIASMLVGFYIRYNGERSITDPVNGIYYYQLIGVALFVFLFVEFMFGLDKQFFKRGFLMEMLIVLRNNMLVFAGITTVLYIVKLGDKFPRLALFYFLIGNSVLSYIIHQLLKVLIPSWYKKFGDPNRILIITDTEYAEDIMRDLKADQDYASKYIGIVFADTDEIEEYQDVPVVSKIKNIIEYCQIGYLDEVVVATAKSHRKEMKPVMNAISEMGITVHYYISVPELTGAKNKTMRKVGSHYMMTYATRFVSDWEMVLKRIMDIAGGLVGCVFLLIFTIILGPLIIIESPGPLFFSQKRVGRNGRYFKMYKFRSMYADAEERKKELMKDNEMDGLMFKMEDDPRITKIGKFIRKTSIDEFPQFWNVLKGDMSLVGTRPPTLDEFANYSPYHKKRLSFRPGITGLWQATGRNDISNFDDVVSLDVEYIDNWSVFLDIKILFMTVFAMFRGK